MIPCLLFYVFGAVVCLMVVVGGGVGGGSGCGCLEPPAVATPTVERGHDVVLVLSPQNMCPNPIVRLNSSEPRTMWLGA